MQTSPDNAGARMLVLNDVENLNSLKPHTVNRLKELLLVRINTCTFAHDNRNGTRIERASRSSLKEMEKTFVVEQTSRVRRSCWFTGVDVYLQSQKDNSAMVQFLKDRYELNYIVATLGTPCAAILDGLTRTYCCVSVYVPSGCRCCVWYAYFMWICNGAIYIFSCWTVLWIHSWWRNDISSFSYRSTRSPWILSSYWVSTSRGRSHVGSDMVFTLSRHLKLVPYFMPSDGKQAAREAVARLNSYKLSRQLGAFYTVHEPLCTCQSPFCVL